MVDQVAEQVAENEEALPQLLGDFAPIDVWQQHMNTVFYGLRGERLRELYQTFAAADYRLAYALAADYVERATQRQKLALSGAQQSRRAGPGTGAAPLTIMDGGAATAIWPPAFSITSRPWIGRDALSASAIRAHRCLGDRAGKRQGQCGVGRARGPRAIRAGHGAGTAIVSRRVD